MKINASYETKWKWVILPISRYIPCTQLIPNGKRLRGKSWENIQIEPLHSKDSKFAPLKFPHLPILIFSDKSSRRHIESGSKLFSWKLLVLSFLSLSRMQSNNVCWGEEILTAERCNRILAHYCTHMFSCCFYMFQCYFHMLYGPMLYSYVFMLLL